MNDKDAKRELFDEPKIETLDQSESQVVSAYGHLLANSLLSCNLLTDEIKIVPCVSKAQSELWLGYVHLVSSLPFRRAVGRRKRFFVTCNDCILGMVNLTSAMAQLRPRDEFIGWGKEEKWTDKKINGIYNIQTCVPTRKYADLLTGKLLVYLVFSNDVVDFLEESYGDHVIGFETTSLYGKGSMYNRIPFLKYLGLTDGNSAMYITQGEWQRILAEYREVYPDTKTNRLAPVKYQIVDKLSSWYASHGRDFPYQYCSVEYQRGVYFGYTEGVVRSTPEMVNEWRSRWLVNRAKTHSLSVKSTPTPVSLVAEKWLEANLSQPALI